MGVYAGVAGIDAHLKAVHRGAGRPDVQRRQQRRVLCDPLRSNWPTNIWDVPDFRNVVEPLFNLCYPFEYAFYQPN